MTTPPQDHAALVALVAKWKQKAHDYKTLVGSGYLGAAQELEAALAAAPAGDPVGEPARDFYAEGAADYDRIKAGEFGPSEAPACDDCKDTGIRVNSEGRDAYCHCTASPRPTPQPSASRCRHTSWCIECNPTLAEPSPDPIDPTIGPELGLGHSGRFVQPRKAQPSAPAAVPTREQVEALPRSSLAIAVVDLLALLPQSMRNLGMAADMERALKSHMRLFASAPAAVLPEPVDVEALAREAYAAIVSSADGRQIKEIIAAAILAALRRVQPPQEPKTCAWRMTTPINLWSTACGHGVEADAYADDRFTFCAFCGGRIVDAAPAPTDPQEGGEPA
jgi:hypothetical protein